MKALGKKLRESQVNPITIVYKTSGSCTNIDAMYTGTKLTTNPFGCGSFVTTRNHAEFPYFTTRRRGFGIGSGTSPSA